jgi:hypothetical protein
VGGGDISNCQNEGGHIPNQASCKDRKSVV